MQAGGSGRTSSGEEAKEPQETSETKDANGSTVEKADDEWGKFYSMPPKWKKGETTESKSGLTDENIGHRLASLLRYHLDDVSGISTDDDGWVTVEDIVENAAEVGLAGCTVEDLIRVVENNEHSTRGKRFESDGSGRIKATYRHPPKDRRDRWDMRRDIWGRNRISRSRGYGWNSNGWDDYNKWSEGWQENGDKTWTEWKKPGFSPSPDDVIVKDSSWAEAAEKSEHADGTRESSSAAARGISQSDEKVVCKWEQWFTPDSMELYYYNTETEEVFFPGDAGDTEEKGWSRYVETEGARKGQIYWWHEKSDRAFFEEDAVGEEEEAA